MPSWNELFESVQQDKALEEKKKEFFRNLQSITGRNYVVYFSCWQQKQGIPGGAFSIDDDDRNGFMNALYGLDKSKGLDLILHTPGGDFAATQSIVGYLYSFFSGDVRVIVPHTAMSAGTMMACASKEIIMGRHSNLGPIDPQINGMPANEFVDLFMQALNDIQKGVNIAYWKMTLQKYPPTFFGMCNNAIKASKKVVGQWLERSMLIGKSKADIDNTVNYLADYHSHLQHNTRLMIDDLRDNTALKIVNLEDNQEFQENILSLYHCYQIMAGQSNVSKLIENQNSVKFVKQHAQVLMGNPV